MALLPSRPDCESCTVNSSHRKVNDDALAKTLGAHRERVAVVISTFRPGPEVVGRCTAIVAQAASVIVVDDGSGHASEPVLEALDTAGATVVRQHENLGIATAMNRGFAAARAAGAELVVTFDQDSEVPADFIDALVSEFDRVSGLGVNVGMVAPEFFSLTPQTRMDQSREFLEAYAPIQSGLLMPLSVVEQLGPQREDYFIDLVDTEYFLRARGEGFEAVCVPGLVLPHGFGHRLYVHLMGRRLVKRDGTPRMVAVSSPFRYYYRARNRLALNRAYRAQPGMRALLRRDGLRDLVLDYGVALWSARGKLKLFSLIWAGWRDARRGRMGKISPKLAARAARITWKHPVR